MNGIALCGNVESEIEFSHETKNEKFYSFYLSCMRASGTEDIIHCIASQVFTEKIKVNERIRILGEIRTRNVLDESGKNHLDVFVFVNDVMEAVDFDENAVIIDGYVCSEIKLRETPSGRNISDILIASGRRYHKTDYIPCIAWGRYAIKASEIPVGTRLCMSGRMQSRIYTKRFEDGKVEERIAYEVSISKFDEVKDNEDNDETDNIAEFQRLQKCYIHIRRKECNCMRCEW